MITTINLPVTETAESTTLPRTRCGSNSLRGLRIVHVFSRQIRLLFSAITEAFGCVWSMSAQCRPVLAWVTEKLLPLSVRGGVCNLRWKISAVDGNLPSSHCCVICVRSDTMLDVEAVKIKNERTRASQHRCPDDEQYKIHSLIGNIMHGLGGMLSTSRSSFSPASGTRKPRLLLRQRPGNRKSNFPKPYVLRYAPAT